MQNIESRPQIEVIRVAQDNLSPYILFQFADVYCLYAAGCTYGHEYGCFHLTVVCGDQTRPGIRPGIGM